MEGYESEEPLKEFECTETVVGLKKTWETDSIEIQMMQFSEKVLIIWNGRIEETKDRLTVADVGDSLNWVGVYGVPFLCIKEK